MITVLCCRGIGESLRENMLSNVTKYLDPARFRAREVPWSASYGAVGGRPDGASFGRALADGRTILLEMIRNDPYPVILKGYSGGAALAGNVAAEIGLGNYKELDVRGVGLISDPLRSLDYNLPGWGIAGTRPIRGLPVWQMADPTDVITCCPKDSPLRTLADQSAAFSLADPIAWGSDLVDRLSRSRWQEITQTWHPVEIYRRYSEAMDDAAGYLWRGDHVSYNTRLVPGSTRTYTEWLADRINEIKE